MGIRKDMNKKACEHSRDSNDHAETRLGQPVLHPVGFDGS